MYNKSNILVTGGAGFIGSNLIRRLISVGANIRATIHKKNPYIIDDRIEYVKCDLRDEKTCQSMTNDIDYVFMCSANTSGAAIIEKTPLVHVIPNVIMNSYMLEASYAANVKKFMFISTNTVYPEVDHPVKEDEMMRGEVFEKYFCVGWMKRFSEILCEMYATKIENPMPIVVIRPGNVYGEFDDFEWETSHVLPALIRKIIERHDPIEIWGDGEDIKDFIYVDDLIDGILLAMESTDIFVQINIASGHPCSIKYALHLMLEIEDFHPVIQFDKSKPMMIPKRFIDISKAKEKLHFEPKTSMINGLRKTIEWYRHSLKG